MRAITAAIWALAYLGPQLKLSWIETVLTFHPALPMRAALVAAAAAAVGILALASLSPTGERPRASVSQQPQFRAPTAVLAARDPLALARADSVNR